MTDRVAVISIIVENSESVNELNNVLHEYGSHIIGRMGLPYPAKNINLICIAVDAPMDEINALCDSLGRIEGVTANAACSSF